MKKSKIILRVGGLYKARDGSVWIARSIEAGVWMRMVPMGGGIWAHMHCLVDGGGYFGKTEHALDIVKEIRQ